MLRICSLTYFSGYVYFYWQKFIKNYKNEILTNKKECPKEFENVLNTFFLLRRQCSLHLHDELPVFNVPKRLNRVFVKNHLRVKDGVVRKYLLNYPI